MSSSKGDVEVNGQDDYLRKYSFTSTISFQQIFFGPFFKMQRNQIYGGDNFQVWLR